MSSTVILHGEEPHVQKRGEGEPQTAEETRQAPVLDLHSQPRPDSLPSSMAAPVHPLGAAGPRSAGAVRTVSEWNVQALEGGGHRVLQCVHHRES